MSEFLPDRGTRAGSRSDSEFLPTKGRTAARRKSPLPPIDAERVMSTAFRPVDEILGGIGERIDATQAALMVAGSIPLKAAGISKFPGTRQTPVAGALKDVAKAVVTGEPPEGLPRGDASYTLARESGLSPWQARTVAVAGGLPLASGLNVVGKRALLPAGRAVANAEVGSLRTRAIPGVKEVLEFFKPGASLPNAVRDGFYRTLREAEGAADWKAFLREKQFGDAIRLSEKAQDAITHAIETRTIGTLPKASQDIANALVREFDSRVTGRSRIGLRKNVLSSNVEYVPRVATKAERTRLGVRPYGDPIEGPPPALSTGGMSKRTEAGRASTAAQMEAAAGEGRSFEPIIKGTFLSGAAADRQIMHADIIRGLDKQYGRAVKAGERSIADITGTTVGFKPGLQKRFKSRALPPELHEVVKRLNESFAPQEFGRFKAFMGWANNQFRKWALFSPGFVIRNMQNNVAQTAVFGNVNPVNWTSAVSLRNKLAKGKLSAAEMADVEEMIRHGVIGRGQVAQETARGTTRGHKLSPFTWTRSAGTWAEDVSRMSFYRFLKGQGLSPIQAAEKVDAVLFNYSPRFASKGFATVRKHAMPFINWRANIPQLFVRSVLERPGSVGMIGNVRGQMNAADPDAVEALPDYLKEQGATYVGKSGEGKDRFYIPQGYGTFDVNAIAGSLAGGPKTTAQEAATMSYPQYSLSYAAATGIDPLTGWKIRDWGAFLRRAAPQLKIPLLLADVKAGKAGAKQRLISFLAGYREVERNARVPEGGE